MSSDIVLSLMANLLWTGLVVMLPLLGVTMLVGLLVSIFQVITQIQEMSLTFVPKLVAAGVVLVVAGPWMLQRLAQYIEQLWTGIPHLL